MDTMMRFGRQGELDTDAGCISQESGKHEHNREQFQVLASLAVTYLARACLMMAHMHKIQQRYVLTAGSQIDAVAK